MSTLVLPLSYRKAIDWIGNRYEHGFDFYKLLTAGDWDHDWDDPGPVTITMTPEQTRAVVELIQRSPLDCFSEDLVDYLREWARANSR
jgi:hypothetical protein